jgi:hypothetical protein
LRGWSDYMEPQEAGVVETTSHPQSIVH